MKGPLRYARALARRRRPVSRAELTAFSSALRGPQRISALRALVDGAIVAGTLERRGLRPLVRDRSDLPTAELWDARRVSAAVDAGLGVLPVKATCLRRSVTLLRELNRRERSAVLHIGVRTGPDGIEAHAWVQVGDQVVNDDPESTATYTELATGEAERLLPRFA